MKTSFAGWEAVARQLRAVAGANSPEVALNDGQRASLRAIASRITVNGILIADEVGMGKTRIAAVVAKAVMDSGGRCAVVIPPGLGFQWKTEFRTCGIQVPSVIRSLSGYLDAWDPDKQPSTAPWFREPVVMISHRFSDWRLSENSDAWRWALLAEVYAQARRLTDGRLPRFYSEFIDELAGQRKAQGVIAAALSIAEAVPKGGGHPARRLMKRMLSSVTWPDPTRSENYGRKQSLREWLLRIVGLGLGVFDLIIIDEAHKSRDDGSDLSRVLDTVLLGARDCRRLALTATPIELNVRQWDSTLRRINVCTEQLDSILTATRNYSQAIRELRLGWRTSEDLRQKFAEAAGHFQKALSPYLIRRDKREDEDVRRFEKYSGLALHDYRRQEQITVETDDLTDAWRQAVCAAEALSVIQVPDVDLKTKRLRLTIGNGHGICSIIDECLRDERDDRRQSDLDATEPGQPLAPNSAALARAVWWRDRLRQVFPAGEDHLFHHPAIVAAVNAIERDTDRGEKVLVFGRFTRPLRVLVSLLNARQMLKRLSNGANWPQRKVHGDRNGGYGDSEWPAVRAAHQQLSSAIDLNKLDDILASQYRRDSDQRARERDSLVPRIRAGLSKLSDVRKYLAILNVIEQHVLPGESSDDDDQHLTLLARAIAANLDGIEADEKEYAKAFIVLVDAASAGDDIEDPDIDEEKAKETWGNLEDHLREGYTSRQGGFARLMYGETKPEARRMMQLAFNRPNSFPRVLVAQSMVGREGLNLHESCRKVVLLHAEWNPGVVEQQIGRVDRVNSRWAKELKLAIGQGVRGAELPRIEIRPVIFKGTYDEHNWKVLQERWDDLRAQLHGEPIPARLRNREDEEGRRILEDIGKSRPEFSPLGKRGL